MATNIPFIPPQNAPFTFTPTLGGTRFSGVVTWNVYGRRWYLNLYTLTGTLVLAIALQPSSMDFPQNLLEGYASVFGTGTLHYDQPNQQIVVGP